VGGRSTASFRRTQQRRGRCRLARVNTVLHACKHRYPAVLRPLNLQHGASAVVDGPRPEFIDVGGDLQGPLGEELRKRQGALNGVRLRGSSSVRHSEVLVIEQSACWQPFTGCQGVPNVEITPSEPRRPHWARLRSCPATAEWWWRWPTPLRQPPESTEPDPRPLRALRPTRSVNNLTGQTRGLSWGGIPRRNFARWTDRRAHLPRCPTTRRASTSQAAASRPRTASASGASATARPAGSTLCSTPFHRRARSRRLSWRRWIGRSTATPCPADRIRSAARVAGVILSGRGSL
jgi:hypothetical protein